MTVMRLGMLENLEAHNHQQPIYSIGCEGMYTTGSRKLFKTMTSKTPEGAVEHWDVSVSIGPITIHRAKTWGLVVSAFFIGIFWGWVLF